MNSPRRGGNSTPLSLDLLLKFPTIWKKYKSKFKKKYENEGEDIFRRQIFFTRYNIVEDHNKKFKKKLVPFRIMVTEYSDLTEEEIANLMENNLLKKTETDLSSDEEEWGEFQKRKNRRFKSPSLEEIPKFFFVLKIADLRRFVGELKEIGLDADLKGRDKFCDYSEFAGMSTVFDEKDAVLEKIRRQKRLSKVVK